VIAIPLPTNRKSCPRNRSVVDVSHGATDASALGLRRIGLLPWRRDGNNTQNKGTQPAAYSHVKQDAAADSKGSGGPISLQRFFAANDSSTIAKKPCSGAQSKMA
jgi:hypothetical protein